ncbi:MAG: metallophosphoesterase family protein [Clostridia bacterium]|nr:metallophosphoesterase family protein [Clostridia bacterium]
MKRFCAVLLCAVFLAFSVLPAAAAEPDTIGRISCCVFGDGKTGRGFCWFTRQPGGTDLELVKTADFDGDFSNALCYSGEAKRYRDRYSHQVAVTDLEPGTAYVYRVGDRTNGLWSNVCSFRTDDGDEAFSFLAIADVQAGSIKDFRHAAETLRSGLALVPEADFVVNLGDYVNDNTNAEWDAYAEAFAFANETTTAVPVAGNHDGNITNKFNTNCFENTFCLDRSANRSLEGVYYSFDYGNAHFAVLNSNDMYPMSQAQKNWLCNDMSNSAAVWKILLLHRSPYAAGKNINKPDTIIMRNTLLPLIDKLDIDLVLSGHDHMYLRTAPLRGERRAENVAFVKETFSGETVTFAVDPAGTYYAMPSTAGVKRYSINRNAIDPILRSAETIASTREAGGCFAAVAVEANRLVYRAFTVDDNTNERTLIDAFAVKKTAAKETAGTHLDQSLVSSVAAWPVNLAVALAGMLVSYLKLLVQVVTRAAANG